MMVEKRDGKYVFLCLIVHLSFCYTYEILSFLGPIIVLSSLYFLNRGLDHRNKLISWGIFWTIKDLFWFMLGLTLSSLLALIVFIEQDFSIDLKGSALPLVFLCGQTLCEEIFLGFVPVVYCMEKLKNKYLFFLFVLLLAIVFSLGHQFFYCNISRKNAEPLMIFALIILFGFGMIRILSYIIFKNISFAWGIHLAFNLWFFAPKILLNNTALNESQIFNIILSNNLVAILILFTIVVLIIILIFKKRIFTHQKNA